VNELVGDPCKVRITGQPRNPLTSQCQVDSGAGCGVVDGDGEVLPVVVLGKGPTDRVPVPLLPDVVCVAVTLPVVLTERLLLPDALAVSLGIAVELAVSLALGDDDADEHAVEPISLAVPAQTTRATPKGTKAQVSADQCCKSRDQDARFSLPARLGKEDQPAGHWYLTPAIQ
jgi:hypothetical protein